MAKTKAKMPKETAGTPSEVDASMGDTPSVSSQLKSETKTIPVMEKAQSLLEYLQGISVAAVWTGKAKMKDVEQKITKAMEMTSRLEERVGDADAKSLCEKLTLKVEEVHSFTEIISNVAQQSKGAEFLDLLVQHKRDLTTMLVKFAKDDMSQCLTDLAKKLVEA